MSRIVKIATISRLTHLEAISREGYIVMCEQEMIKAGENGCDLVLLPENFDTFGTLEMDTARRSYNCRYRSLSWDSRIYYRFKYS